MSPNINISTTLSLAALVFSSMSLAIAIYNQGYTTGSSGGAPASGPPASHVPLCRQWEKGICKCGDEDHFFICTIGQTCASRWPPHHILGSCYNSCPNATKDNEVCIGSGRHKCTKREWIDNGQTCPDVSCTSSDKNECNRLLKTWYAECTNGRCERWNW